MDVVVVKCFDWMCDLFILIQENGYFYGCGIVDMKIVVVVLVEMLICFKCEGFKFSCDIVLLFLGDEEIDMVIICELVKCYYDVEFLFNVDVGGGMLDFVSGKLVVYQIQVVEKIYVDFYIIFILFGGYFSELIVDNVIYCLVKVIDCVGGYVFLLMINDIICVLLCVIGVYMFGVFGVVMMCFVVYLDDVVVVVIIFVDLVYVGQICIICVVIMFDGGYVFNVLLQSVSVNVNCCIFFGILVVSVCDILIKVIDDFSVSIIVLLFLFVESFVLLLCLDVIVVVIDVVYVCFFGVEIVFGMFVGVFDSMYFCNVGVFSYGVDVVFIKFDDIFVYGFNEKLLVLEVGVGLDFWYWVLMQLGN